MYRKVHWLAALALFSVILESNAGYITTLHPVTLAGVPIHLTASGPWQDRITQSPFVPNQYRWDVDANGIWDATTAVPELRMSFPPSGSWYPIVKAVQMNGLFEQNVAYGTLHEPDGWAPLRIDTTAGVLPAGFVNSMPVAGIGGLSPCYFAPSWVNCITAVRGQSLTLDGAPSSDPNEAVGDYIDRYIWRDLSANVVLADTLYEQVSLATSMHPWLNILGDRWIQLQVTDAFGATSAMQWAIVTVIDSVPEPSTLSLTVLAAALGLARRATKRIGKSPRRNRGQTTDSAAWGMSKRVRIYFA